MDMELKTCTTVLHVMTEENVHLSYPSSLTSDYLFDVGQPKIRLIHLEVTEELKAVTVSAAKLNCCCFRIPLNL